MKVTFLVGNGFDIASGIDTSYSSFYKWYCSRPSEKPHIDAFKCEIKNDIDNGGENWADFEIGLGRYTAKFTTETVEQFIECYEDAHEKIIEYLEGERKKYSDSVSDANAKKLRDGITSFYQELPPVDRDIFHSIFKSDESDNTIIQFISFNYTNLLDKCVEVLAKEPLKRWTYATTKEMRVNKSVIHIHGTSSKFPILGVNDPTQIENQELLSVPQFSEMMIKSQSVKAIGELWHKLAKQIIEDSRIICILGMSLGCTDAKWWQQIMSWLKNGNTRRLIIFWHTDIPLNGLSIFKHTREIAQIKSKITGYSDYSEDVIKSISERIHVVINTNKVLQITLTDKNKIAIVAG